MRALTEEEYFTLGRRLIKQLEDDPETRLLSAFQWITILSSAIFLVGAQAYKQMITSIHRTPKEVSYLED